MVIDHKRRRRTGANAGATPAATIGGRPRRPRSWADYAFLTALSAIAAWNVASYGGMSRPHLEGGFVALGLTALVFWCTRSAGPRAPNLSWRWTLALAGFPLLAGLQLVPLPIELVAVFSPARAGLEAAAAPVLGESTWIPLSVEPGTTFAHLARILSYLTIFLAIRELGWTLGPQRWMLALPPAGIAAAEAGLAIRQWTAGAAQVQATGSYVNPNHFAGLLGLAAPLGVALVFAAWPAGTDERTRRRRDMGMAGATGAVAIIAVGVVVSVSRMGLVSATAGVCVTVALLLNRRRSEIPWTFHGKAAALLAATAILAIFVYAPPDKLISRFGYLTSGEGIAAQSRLPLWRDTLQLIREYPLFGCGLGAFAAPFLRHKISEPMLFDQYAHNDYLQVLAETGIAGLALLLWALFATLSSCWSRRASSRIDRALMAGAAGALTAIALHSLTDFNLYIPANAMIVAWIGGIAAAVQDTYSQGAEFHASTARPRLTLYLPIRRALRG